MRPFLILQVGHTVAPLIPRRGDFDDWFRAGLGLEPADARVVRPHAGEALPDPREHRAVVVTGSASMVTDREPWSEATKDWLAALVPLDVPLLGVCYGHQLLAEATGGTVGYNPRGREIGTVEVELTAEARTDPLLAALASPLVVQTTHSQSVLRVPPEARVLARNAHDACQAFAVGARAWGVQFHPEFDVDVVRGYLEERREDVEREGVDVAARLAETRESPHGNAILRAFRTLAEG